VDEKGLMGEVEVWIRLVDHVAARQRDMTCEIWVMLIAAQFI